MDARGNRVVLVKVIEWFAKDLKLLQNNNNHQQLLVRLLEYLRGDKKMLLQRMLAKKPKVEFLVYQWRPSNVEDYDIFDPNELKLNVKGVKGLLFSKQGSEKPTTMLGPGSLGSYQAGSSSPSVVSSTSSGH
uniref:Uncharacterized protein n=1 Tax=Cyclophora tenuis TaxID=216820 RepID=A0A7S1GKT3_CYCTE